MKKFMVILGVVCLLSCGVMMVGFININNQEIAEEVSIKKYDEETLQMLADEYCDYIRVKAREINDELKIKNIYDENIEVFFEELEESIKDVGFDLYWSYDKSFDNSLAIVSCRAVKVLPTGQWIGIDIA